jgi:hypothetical protein
VPVDPSKTPCNRLVVLDFPWENSELIKVIYGCRISGDFRHNVLESAQEIASKMIGGGPSGSKPQARQRMIQAIAKLMLVVGVILLVGCATKKFAFNSKSAQAYLATHQDRPNQIQTALSAGGLAEGMNEEEVRLCWGKADRVLLSTTGGVQKTSWGYCQPEVIAHSGTVSVWSEVLVKFATFTNGVLSEWSEVSPSK